MEHERILHILDYLTRCTSDTRAVTIREIQTYLADHCNLRNVSSVTIRRDIDRLIAAGNDITITYGAHNTARYTLKSKKFTFNEIRFIVDSVSINKFLTDWQKQKLIKKFEGLCSEAEVRQLISRITLNSQAEPSMNLLENLEKVHNTISEGRKIHFEYGKYDVQRHVNYYNKRREMLPCKVIYFNERFYLKCLDEETGAFRTYRIDRMRRISAGDKSSRKAALPEPEGVVLDMFEPERFAYVTLRVKRFLLDDMLEQFGKFASVREDSAHPEWVEVRARIGISQSFYQWVMRYGADMEIVAPGEIRDAFWEKLQEIADIYRK